MINVWGNTILATQCRPYYCYSWILESLCTMSPKEASESEKKSLQSEGNSHLRQSILVSDLHSSAKHRTSTQIISCKTP